MATLRILAVLFACVGCDDLAGFGGAVPPLATINFEVTGDFESVRVPGAQAPSLRVTLVWGAQSLPEALCFVPPESSDVAAVVAAGCRDPFGFVPDRAAISVPVEPNVPASLSIDALPSADVMIGDVTARIAYASLIVFDDRDNTSRLELGRSSSSPNDDHGEPDPVEPSMFDVVYGASFVSMTEPDVRVVLREGGYNERAAFYPRKGCGVPAPGFSIAAAGGFSAEAAIAATLSGVLPAQDPATCREGSTDEIVVPIPLRPTNEVAETGCLGRRTDSSVRYRQPPVEPIDLTDRVAACASIPDFGTGNTAGVTQWVVSTPSTERCRGLTHYVLRGCEDDPSCAIPEWDITATPPSWWPCPVQTGP